MVGWSSCVLYYRHIVDGWSVGVIPQAHCGWLECEGYTTGTLWWSVRVILQAHCGWLECEGYTTGTQCTAGV